MWEATKVILRKIVEFFFFGVLNIRYFFPKLFPPKGDLYLFHRNCLIARCSLSLEHGSTI